MVTDLLMPSPELISQNLTWRIYTSADDLPENRVIDIFEDSHGFLWLQSMTGITRFYGTEMIYMTVFADNAVRAKRANTDRLLGSINKLIFKNMSEYIIIEPQEIILIRTDGNYSNFIALKKSK